MNFLKNVTSVKRILASDLNDVKRTSNESVTIPDSLEWEDVEIKIPAKLSIINKVEDKQIVHQAQLTFLTCSWIQDAEHWCYMITLASGSSFLMGDGARPYPVTTSSLSLTDNVTDNQMTEVTVTLSCRENLPVIVSK